MANRKSQQRQIICQTSHTKQVSKTTHLKNVANTILIEFEKVFYYFGKVKVCGYSANYFEEALGETTENKISNTLYL